MYSIGLLMLYVMCDSDDLFYSIRHNIVETGEPWLLNFRETPVVKLVMQMMNLELTVKECFSRWERISEKVERLSKCYFASHGVDTTWLEFQGEADSFKTIEK